MSDKDMNVLTWNVHGISSKSSGKIKCRRLRQNLKSLTPQPGVIMLQEHKVPEADCHKLGTMGLRKGKGFWNGGVYNAEKSRWKAGTAIIVSAAVSHLVLDTGILVPGRAQWLTCLLDKRVIGFLNLYAPNKGPERANFWTQIANTIPAADSWILEGDFNMVEVDADRSSNASKKLSTEEREAWDRLVLRLNLEDVWFRDNFTHRHSLLFS
jgi:exonuclease III